MGQPDDHRCLHAATSQTREALGAQTAPTCRLSLEKIVLLDHKVVHQLYPQIRLRQYIILHVDQPIDLDVNREAIRCKLSRDFLVNLDEHVVAALDNRLLRFFFRDTVGEAQLVQRDL